MKYTNQSDHVGMEEYEGWWDFYLPVGRGTLIVDRWNLILRPRGIASHFDWVIRL